jgi:hypothetical protein
MAWRPAHWWHSSKLAVVGEADPRPVAVIQEPQNVVPALLRDDSASVEKVVCGYRKSN